jgi:parallel beta-helix repeat protein
VKQARLWSVVCLAVAGSAGAPGCGDDDGGNPCEGVTGICVAVKSDATVAEAQRALINATAGSTVAFGEGTFKFKTGLSLDVDDITIIGQGMDKTVLSFLGQTDGAQGLLVTANDFTLEDIAFEDTRGDAVKIEGANRVVIRRTSVKWAGGPNETNGSYGLYPVQSKNVLIEDSYVSGASDAGIYVGQSENVVVRRNKAENNVAGIEIENCKKSDVYGNTATQNTGGILVFNLPGLQVGNGTQTRVYDNNVFANNTSNFAPMGNIVGKVPAGTGVVVLAAQQTEIFNNEIHDNKTNNIGVISYLVLGIPITDPTYDPFPTALHVHDNRISGISDGSNGALGALLLLSLPQAGITTGIVPDMAWDGIMDPSRMTGGEYMEQYKLCFRANGDADFINLNAPPDELPLASTNASAFACTHAALPAVTLEGI